MKEEREELESRSGISSSPPYVGQKMSRVYFCFGLAFFSRKFYTFLNTIFNYFLPPHIYHIITAHFFFFNKKFQKITIQTALEFSLFSSC